MTDYLIHIDQQWLLAINALHTEWADVLMWYTSKSTTWLPLYVLLVGLVVYRFGITWYRSTPHTRNLLTSWRGGAMRVLFVLVGFAVAVGMSDFVSSGIIKPWVCRLRPTHEPALAGMLHLVNGYTGGMYGFVSSHAANTMACALLFSLLYRNRYATIGLMLWVALNCYSRMYLGVHYPGDIVGGLIVGTLVSLPVYYLLRHFIAPKSAKQLRTGGQSEQKAAEDDAVPVPGGS